LIGLLPAIFGFLAGGLNLLLDRLRPGFSYRWLINVIAASLILMMSLAAGFVNSQPVILRLWSDNSSTLFTLQVDFDPATWMFAIGYAFILVLSAITSPQNLEQIGDGKPASGFLIGGAVLLLFVSGNLFTLLIGWVLLEFIQSGYELFDPHRQIPTQEDVILVSLRLLAIFILMLSLFVPAGGTNEGQAAENTSWQSILVLFATGLRSGIFSPQLLVNYWKRKAATSEPYALVWVLAAVVSSLILLAKIPVTNLPTPALVLGTTGVILAGVIAFLLQSGERESRSRLPALVLFFASIAFGAALISQIEVATAWGTAAVFLVGLIYFHRNNGRLAVLIFAFVLLAGIGLPLTPTWPGSNLYSQSGSLVFMMLLIPQSLIFYQFAKDIRGERKTGGGDGDFQNLLILIFLLLMLLSYLSIGLWQVLSLSWRGNWWSGGLILVLGVAGFLLWPRWQPEIFRTLPEIFLRLLSLRWFAGLLRGLFRTLSRTFGLINSILEGDSGILWSMLILVILLSLLVTLISV
jgi:hypothetical protein